MRKPSARALANRASLYRYRPGQDPDAGAVADLAGLIAADVACSVQPGDVTTEVVGHRLRQTTTYGVLFREDHALLPRDLIAWVDDEGLTHSLFVVGQLDQAGRAAMWKVEAVEVR
jgi:pyridoxine 5'-phosphate synthase PdxJ